MNIKTKRIYPYADTAVVFSDSRRDFVQEFLEGGLYEIG